MNLDETGSGADTTAPLFLRGTAFAVRIFGALATAMLLVTFVVVIYAVVQRYFFGRPLLWGDETTGWLLVAMVLLGASEAYRRNDHIAIDILTSRAGGRGGLVLRLASDLAVLGFAVVLGTSAWESIAFARSFGSYTTGNIPIPSWIPQIPIFAGSVLLALIALARIADAIVRRNRT